MESKEELKQIEKRFDEAMLIAEFMVENGVLKTPNCEYSTEGEYINIASLMDAEEIEDDLKYHSSWDWLTPVIEKIESLNVSTEIAYRQGLKAHVCTLLSYDPNVELSITEMGKSKIEITYLAVVEFIKWYNKSKK